MYSSCSSPHKSRKDGGDTGRAGVRQGTRQLSQLSLRSIHFRQGPPPDEMYISVPGRNFERETPIRETKEAALTRPSVSPPLSPRTAGEQYVAAFQTTKQDARSHSAKIRHGRGRHGDLVHLASLVSRLSPGLQGELTLIETLGVVYVNDARRKLSGTCDVKMVLVTCLSFFFLSRRSFIVSIRIVADTLT